MVSERLIVLDDFFDDLLSDALNFRAEDIFLRAIGFPFAECMWNFFPLEGEGFMSVITIYYSDLLILFPLTAFTIALAGHLSDSMI